MNLWRHSLRGSVDWNFSYCSIFPCLLSHSLRGSVDWNRDPTASKRWRVGHSLRGSVDWNVIYISFIYVLCRHSLRGSVDWNFNKLPASCFTALSLPSRECGLKSISQEAIDDADYGHSLRGSVDWNKIKRLLIVQPCNVTPFAGVWIEIQNMKLEHRQKISLSSWE